MKTCLFVFGPESSGTRLVTEMCIAGGAAGEHHHVQTWDSYDPDKDYIVWRRSFPHAKEWPDVRIMNQRMLNLGYSTKALITTRSWYPSIPSQISMRHTGSVAESRDNLKKALFYILDSVQQAKIDFEIISYESLICDKDQTICGMRLFTGLDIPYSFAIDNENLKWKA